MNFNRGIIEDLNDSGDKEAILKNMQDDRVFNTVNRRTGFAQAGNILNEVNRGKLDATSEENISGAGGGGGWFGWMTGSSKSKAAVPEPVIDPEEGKRIRPKLQ